MCTNIKFRGFKMKLNRNLIFISLAIFSVFIALSSISAADLDMNDTVAVDSIPEHIEPSDFTMSARYNEGTGYHWEVSPETHGATFESVDSVTDHPGTCGSSATDYFHFKITSDDYYIKLVLISPTGDIVKELDSDMVN